MAQPNRTARLVETEEALTVLFCLIDDAYAHLNPRGARRYESIKESIKRLADSEVIALALFQQSCGACRERALLPARGRAVLLAPVPGGGGFPSFLVPSAGSRKLRRFLEPLRRSVLSEMVGDPETLLVDSTLLSVLHPRQLSQGSGFPGGAWVRRWGSFSVYGVKLKEPHLICATNGVPISYELTPANVADVSLAEELINEAVLGEGAARRLLGDLGPTAKRGAEGGLGRGEHPPLVTEPSERRDEARQRVETEDPLQPEEGLRSGRDVGEHAHRAGHEDRGQDSGLHT